MFPEVQERITQRHESERTFTYESVAGMPAFVSKATNRWSVEAVDRDRARVSFDGVLQLRGIAGWLLALPLRLVMARTGQLVLADLAHFVETGQPSPRKRRQLGPHPRTAVPAEGVRDAGI